MARMNQKKLVLSDDEANLLIEGSEYELIPNDKGVFLLVDKTKLGKVKENVFCGENPREKYEKRIIKQEQDEERNLQQPNGIEDEKQQVIGLIRKSKLSDLVEGKFEGTLNEKQKKALLELVATQKVFVFKLNDTYKKGVYKLKEESNSEENREKKDSEDFNAPEKDYAKYTLNDDGFLIIKGKNEASNASYHYEKQIKEGILKGIKSFDGNYYLIETKLLETYTNKIINLMQTNNTQRLEEIARKISISKILTRIICEFLKEEGELIEKKKDNYGYIK